LVELTDVDDAFRLRHPDDAIDRASSGVKQKNSSSTDEDPTFGWDEGPLLVNLQDDFLAIRFRLWPCWTAIGPPLERAKIERGKRKKNNISKSFLFLLYCLVVCCCCLLLAFLLHCCCECSQFFNQTKKLIINVMLVKKWKKNSKKFSRKFCLVLFDICTAQKLHNKK
jgi:hypothetical protein